MNDPFELDDLGMEPEPAPLAQAPAGPPPYLDGLNEPQHDAVMAVDGPLLVRAGAGNGKTVAYTLSTLPTKRIV